MRDGHTYVIDGFPRTRENFDGYVQIISDKTTLIGTVILEVPDAIVWKRLMARKRHDDTEEVIKTRMENNKHWETVYPLLNQLAPVIYINGSNPIDKVALEVNRKLRYLL